MHIVIIGNGITGITAARNIRKMSDNRITVISLESKHFYSRTALMYVYMGHMKYEDIKPYEDWFWEKNRIDILQDYVQNIDTGNKKLTLASGIIVTYDKLIIASGSKSKKFGWPGQDLGGVQGLYSLQDLQLLEQNTKKINRAVIVGGGLIGIELAEMLLSRNIPVTFLVREKSFWNLILPHEESEMVTRHISEHGIDLRLSTELKEIKDDGTGRVKSIITNTGEEIACELVGLTAGVSPNIDIIKNTNIAHERGILVNEYFETNVPDVYSAGDCAEFHLPFINRKKIEQVWYTGRIQAEALAKTICGNKTAYNPGIWFNSAKFLDIEYQVYGLVNMNIPGEKSFYWEHEKGTHSIRIVYTDEGVIGFNVMGIRFRQEVCEKWIEKKRNADYVVENLREANFDPEFFDKCEKPLVDKYNKQTGKNLALKKSRGFINFLKTA